MARTVFLHVGLAKTGTTYLQRILHSNRDLLRRNGVLYPGTRRADHFKASLDLRGTNYLGHTYPDAAGAWRRLVDEVNAVRGLRADLPRDPRAHAPTCRIEQAVKDFDTDDVRVVVTARDLARQVPAIWQERLKNRSDGDLRQLPPQHLRLRSRPAASRAVLGGAGPDRGDQALECRGRARQCHHRDRAARGRRPARALAAVRDGGPAS